MPSFSFFSQQYLETKKNNSKKSQLPELPLPNIKAQLTRCLTCYKGPITPPTPATNSPSISKRTRTVHAGNYTFQKNYSKEYTERWSQMEQKIVQHVTGDLPYLFKPFTPCLSSATENKNPAIVACKGNIFSVSSLFSYVWLTETSSRFRIIIKGTGRRYRNTERIHSPKMCKEQKFSF